MTSKARPCHAREAAGRPRLARMLALAYWPEARIEDGTYESYADLARVLAIPRARMTQIVQLRYNRRGFRRPC